jgi:hypothetical protein
MSSRGKEYHHPFNLDGQDNQSARIYRGWRSRRAAFSARVLSI